jgi:hypothetical protein
MAQQSKVGTVATTIGRDSNGDYFVQYHATRVVQWNDKEITLDSGGWFTPTTCTRINQAAGQFNLNFHVSRHGGIWTVRKPDGTKETFSESITFARVEA